MAANTFDLSYRGTAEEERPWYRRLNLNLSAVAGWLGTLLVGVGLLIIGIGWNGAASHLIVVQQLPYLLSAGFLGLGVVVFGAALMLVQAQRTERARVEAKLEELIDIVARGTGGTSVAAAPSLISEAPTSVTDVVVAGASSYHARDCRLVSGRDETEFITRAEASERGLSACRICKPDSE